jgi:hypothetical protein
MRASVLTASMLAGVFFACSSSSSPAPEDAGAGATADPALADGGLPPVTIRNECASVSPVHPVADCDACTRTRCCPEVLQCEASADCKSLRDCLAKCARGDFACSDACRIQHDQGTQPLAGVDRCASIQCAEPCGGAVITPDAG